MPRNNAACRPAAAARSGAMRLNPDRVRRDVIVIGASAGGVMALSELFAALPADLGAVVGVVLHRGMARGQLAAVLGRRSKLTVIEPEGQTAAKQGAIYLAPPDHHLLFERHGVTIQRGPKEHSTRPAVDPLFRSAAAAHGNRVVGVLLTGCGEDGVSGMIAISGVSGLTLVQDPDEAYMPFMPLNALRFDDVSGVVRIHQLGPVLAALAGGEAVQVMRRDPMNPTGRDPAVLLRDRRRRA